jgi:gas vesicle protein
MARGRIILGALAGVAAGALIGILFAPDKGSSTRKKIVHKGEDYVENLKEKINGILHDGKRSDKVRENVSSAM